MDPKLRQRYQNLARLAENEASTHGEREQARVLMAALVEKYGVEVKAWATWNIEPQTPAHQQLLLHLSAHHACRMKQEAGVFRFQGPPELVDKLRTDFMTYGPALDALLSVATLAAIRGFGVYSSRPAEGQTLKDTSAGPTAPYALHQALQRVFSGAQAVGVYHRRPDYTLKQLPAPKTPRRGFLDFDSFFRKL